VFLRSLVPTQSDVFHYRGGISAKGVDVWKVYMEIVKDDDDRDGLC
jgi:hypothetical protein